MTLTTPIHPAAAAVSPHWYSSIHANDWLSASLNAISIFAAIMIASFITPKLEARKARRDQRERLLRVMLHTWPSPANPDWQSSITLIPFDFKGCKAVLEARQSYLDQVNETPPEEEAAAEAHYDEARARQAALIVAVANELGFDITTEGFQSGIYVSKGFTDRENLTLNAMFAWQRIAAALERNNELVAGMMTAQASPASPPSECGSQGPETGNH
jgi:hypothetical protein